MKIIKRNGSEAVFDITKIIAAITKANKVVPDAQRLTKQQIIEISDHVQEVCYARGHAMNVEEIQDIVEDAIMATGAYEVARRYITYRYVQSLKRTHNTTDDKILSLIECNNEEVKQENSNKNPTVNSVQRDYMAGEVSKDLTMRMLLPPEIVKAHEEGIIHFHDADYYAQHMHNCDLVNLDDMLQNGTVISGTLIEKPHSFSTACNIATQIIAQVASSQYGGQTANRADEHLAQYAKKDYEKFLEEARETIPDGMPVEFARRQVESAKKNEPAKLHFGSREPLPMDTPFHTDVDELEQEREILAKIRTRKAIYDAMQTMEYQINSNRVSNGQTPFVTVGFGLGTDWFSREVQRAILLNRIRGLGKEHHTAIFPKLVFTVKHGVNADPGDPNYDLKQLALESATKRMYPDVVFYENIVKITGSFKAPMGCRSFLQGWINPETGKDEEDGRMNLGVVTVNVPRIAIESHGDKARFWKLFDERMEVAHQALQFRIMRCKEATPVNAPTLFRFGAFGRLGANDNVDQLFKNERATVSLGYIGLAETTAVFYGKNWIRDHGWDPEGKEFALSIVKRMNELCKQWSKAEGYHYSVYSTPAESLTDRFNRMDREKFGRIEGVTDHDFYTNSFHYPVWLQPTPMEKLSYEKDFPYYASGGFINYCEYPCLQDNPKALEAVWDYAYNIGIGYLGTNTPIDHCFVCGFQGDFEPTEEGFKCPECGNSDPDHCNVTKRTCGYLGNPVQRPMVHGRHEEIAHRVKHMSGETGHVTLSDGSEREWFEEAK